MQIFIHFIGKPSRDKCKKYTRLTDRLFKPVTFETNGAYGDDTDVLIREITFDPADQFFYASYKQ